MSSASSLDNDTFHAQIIATDSYNCGVTRLDKLPTGNNFDTTTVVRVYGHLPTGHTVCVHVHGVLHYFFVEAADTVFPDLKSVNDFAEKLSLELDQLVQKFAGREMSSKAQYIASVQPCKAVPFYGYHVGYRVFFKINLLNASCKLRVLEVLASKQLGNFKDYESNASLVLQFMTDYNLFGCGWLKLRRCLFRYPVYNSDDAFYAMKLNDEVIDYANRFLTKDNVLEGNFRRISNTFLEIDVSSEWILNRQELQVRDLHLDFVEKLHSLASFKYISSLTELWKSSEYRRKANKFPMYQEPKDIKRNDEPQEWVDQQELNDVYRYAILSAKQNDDASNSDKSHQSYESYILLPKYFDSLLTPFQLIKASFPVLDTSTDLQLLDQPISENGPDISPVKVAKVKQVDLFKVKMKNLHDLDHIESSFSFDDISFNLTDDPTSKRRKTSILTGPRMNLSIASSFPISGKSYMYGKPPPLINELNDNIHQLVLPRYLYPDPHYSKQKDIPDVPFVYNNKRYKLQCTELSQLPGLQFENQSISKMIQETKSDVPRYPLKTKNYIFTVPKPTYEQVRTLIDRASSDRKRKNYQSQIEYLTYKSKSSATPLQVSKRPDGYNNLSLLEVEIHVKARPNLSPDPKIDPINAIFWKVSGANLKLDIVDSGILIFSNTNRYGGLIDQAIEVFDEEIEIFKELVSLVKLFDTDILSGFEIHGSSWGYIIERCQHLEYDICKDLSRVHQYSQNKVADKYGYSHASGITITGRHMVNIWRLLKKELALTSYTLENVVHNVFKVHTPHYEIDQLAQMFDSGTPSEVSLLLNYYMRRVNYCTEILDHLDIIYRIVEQARVGGIDFYSVFYRGSQYKVESFLLRIAKLENFVLLSPSKKQVRKQKALECIPLVMEPLSGFYKSPLVVLDFQSLYPSIIIAYNYCYSTCLGRLRGFDASKKTKLGVNSFDIPPGLLNLLKDDITLSPNGLMFVNSSVRKSLLAKMLLEILETRVMLKDTMKLFKDDNGIRKLYENLQLALKLIANVTYGYASATFSGRMPCSDIADAIVQTGRETLERSINFIEANELWNAKVVYGDTDSLFVYLPGRSKSDAFELGREIALQVTQMNPKPVVLKFEKVYFPGFLLAKKRYIGYSYESEEQKDPIFDAKGIETVRRDGIPAQQKITEKSLRILFETADISKVKSYVSDQFTKIINNKVSIQDFCFAKEIKMGAYKAVETMPPGALLAQKKMNIDKAYEPQYKERVPYVIMKADRRSRLRDKAVLLQDIIRLENFQLDSEYYITKMLIPPLERIFNLVGVDIKDWYYEIPKTLNRMEPQATTLLQKYIEGTQCVTCDQLATVGKFCQNCHDNLNESSFQLITELKLAQDKLRNYNQICRNCSVNNLSAGNVTYIACTNTDCSIFYSRTKGGEKVNSLTHLLNEVNLI